VDEFNFPATGANQGSNVPFTINNMTPVVSAVTINGGAAITLEAATTKAVTLTATVTDNNGCESISSVQGYVYRSGITYTGCDTSGEANNNNCYPEVSCSVVGGTCEGASDASANYTCSVNLQYYADPTDTNTQYPTDTWLTTIKATDSGAITGNTEVTTGVNVNSLLAFGITENIVYGGVMVGSSTDPLDEPTVMSNIGNVGLNQELSGSEYMCTNFPTCTGGTPIGVGNQKYSLETSTAYSLGTALTTSAVLSSIKVYKPTSATTQSKSTYWGINIPVGTLAGTYTGQNFITAVKSNIEDWEPPWTLDFEQIEFQNRTNTVTIPQNVNLYLETEFIAGDSELGVQYYKNSSPYVTWEVGTAASFQQGDTLYLGFFIDYYGWEGRIIIKKENSMGLEVANFYVYVF